jgi:hypothetical protein
VVADARCKSRQERKRAHHAVTDGRSNIATLSSTSGSGIPSGVARRAGTPKPSTAGGSPSGPRASLFQLARRPLPAAHTPRREGAQMDYQRTTVVSSLRTNASLNSPTFWQAPVQTIVASRVMGIERMAQMAASDCSVPGQKPGETMTPPGTAHKEK